MLASHASISGWGLPLFAEAAGVPPPAAWVGVAFSVVVLLTGLGLIAWSAWAVQRFRRGGAGEVGEATFRRRQFYRRVQAGGLCALAGALMLVGSWWPGRDTPTLLGLAYWGFVALLVVWMLLTALADMLASWHYYGRLRDESDLEQLKLQVLADRLKRVQGNGKALAEPYLQGPATSPSAAEDEPR